MRHLTSLDAQFLAIENGRTCGHVCVLSILAPEATAQPLSLGAIREHVAARLHLLSPLRQRIVEVPLRISYPYGIEDPDLDLDFHLRELTLLPPAGSASSATRSR